MTTIKSTESVTDPLSNSLSSNPLSRRPPLPTAQTPDTVSTPNLWQWLCIQTTRHPRLSNGLCLLALISGTSFLSLFLLFRGAWSQHQDNIAILQTVLKMELARASAWPVSDDSGQVITRTYLTLESYVEQDGWIWINRFGSTVTYGHQDQWLIVSCAAYSPLYLLCEFSEIP